MPPGSNGASAHEILNPTSSPSAAPQEVTVRDRWQARREEAAQLDSVIELVLEPVDELATGYPGGPAAYLWVPQETFCIRDLAARFVYAELLFRCKADPYGGNNSDGPLLVVTQPMLAQCTGLSLDQVKRGVRVLKAQGWISTEKFKWLRRTLRRYHFCRLSETETGRGVRITPPLFFIKSLPARLVLAQLLYLLDLDRRRPSAGLTRRGDTYRCMARSYAELGVHTGLSPDQVRRAVRYLKRMGFVRTQVLMYRGCPTTHFVVNAEELKTYL
jgi:hypothetical protein